MAVRLDKWKRIVGVQWGDLPDFIFLNLQHRLTDFQYEAGVHFPSGQNPAELEIVPMYSATAQHVGASEPVVFPSLGLPTGIHEVETFDEGTFERRNHGALWDNALWTATADLIGHVQPHHVYNRNPDWLAGIPGGAKHGWYYMVSSGFQFLVENDEVVEIQWIQPSLTIAQLILIDIEPLGPGEHEFEVTVSQRNPFNSNNVNLFAYLVKDQVAVTDTENAFLNPPGGTFQVLVDAQAETVEVNAMS